MCKLFLVWFVQEIFRLANLWILVRDQRWKKEFHCYEGHRIFFCTLTEALGKLHLQRCEHPVITEPCYISLLRLTGFWNALIFRRFCRRNVILRYGNVRRVSIYKRWDFPSFKILCCTYVYFNEQLLNTVIFPNHFIINNLLCFHCCFLDILAFYISFYIFCVRQASVTSLFTSFIICKLSSWLKYFGTIVQPSIASHSIRQIFDQFLFRSYANLINLLRIKY